MKTLSAGHIYLTPKTVWSKEWVCVHTGVYRRYLLAIRGCFCHWCWVLWTSSVPGLTLTAWGTRATWQSYEHHSLVESCQIQWSVNQQEQRTLKIWPLFWYYVKLGVIKDTLSHSTCSWITQPKLWLLSKCPSLTHKWCDMLIFHMLNGNTL